MYYDIQYSDVWIILTNGLGAAKSWSTCNHLGWDKLMPIMTRGLAVNTTKPSKYPYKHQCFGCSMIHYIPVNVLTVFCGHFTSVSRTICQNDKKLQPKTLFRKVHLSDRGRQITRRLVVTSGTKCCHCKQHGFQVA